MDEAIIREQETTKKLVKELMETDQRCRNDDLWLILQVWQRKQQIKVFIPFDQMHEMIAPETITRCRRDVQNTDGELLPTDPRILLRRQVKEQTLREYYAKRNPEIISDWEKLKYGIKD